MIIKHLTQARPQTFQFTSGLILLFSSVLLAPAILAQESCDTECLRDLADQYLAAILEHDASKAPLTESPATTYNSAPVARDNAGPWANATSYGDHQIYIADAESGQIAVVTSVNEGSKTNILALRLKIENRLISEVEMMYQRDKGDTGAHFNPDGWTDAEPEFSSILPENQRSSREQLLAWSQSTWHANSVPVAYEPNCKHFEEGDMATDPRACPRPDDTPVDTNARSPIADVERGLVVSFGVVEGLVLSRGFFVPHSMLQGTATDLMEPQPGGVKPMPASAHVMQVIKFVNGKVRISQAYMNIQPTGARSPWVESL